MKWGIGKDFFFLFLLFLKKNYFREKEKEWGGGAEGERESQAGSTFSVDPMTVGS